MSVRANVEVDGGGRRRLRVAATSATPATAVVSSETRAGQLRIGSTRTQDDFNGKITAQASLLGALGVVNQHIIGFGGANDDLWPSAVDPFDWSNLDADLAALAATGVDLMITLCGCPTWMSVGPQEPEHLLTWPTPGTFDEFDYYPPHPDHLSDWQALCFAVADRYDGTTVGTKPGILVSEYQVWNETKKMFIGSLNRWDYDHYNAVFDAAYAGVHAAQPNAIVGGPYVVAATWSEERRSFQNDTLGVPEARYLDRDLEVVDQFLAASGDYDGMVLIDVKSQSNDHFGDPPSSPIGISQDPWLSMGRKMREMKAYIDDLPATRTQRVGTTRQIGVSEYYTMGTYITSTGIANGDDPFTLFAGHDESTMTENKLASICAWSWIETLLAGIDYVLMWKFLGGWIDRQTDSTWPLGIYDSTDAATALHAPLRWWKDNIQGRVDVREVEIANPMLRAISGNSKMMIVSRSPDAQSVLVDGVLRTVPADYGILYVDLV